MRVATLFLLAVTASAEPAVPAFDRFHAAQPTADSGRLLFNELGCANCHTRDTQLPARKGPALAGVTQRVQREWLSGFFTGTHQLAKEETQPVLHYLASLPNKTAKPKVPKYMNAERGSDVYHTAGCVACHEPGADFQPPAGTPKKEAFTHRSVPFADLKAKYSLSSLMAFLDDPLKVRTDGRMPHIALHDADVTDLAAYLLDMQQSDGSNVPQISSFKAEPALSAKGKAIVQRANCAACHDLPKDVAAKPIALTKGDTCTSVRYDLSDAQQRAIRAYLSGTDTITPKAQLSLTLQALNCTQCHERDGIGGPDAARKAYFTGDHNLGDTGLLPPPLSEAGSKLQPAWLADVLAGKNRVRPYLHTQMPNYGKVTDKLAALFATTDQRADDKPLAKGDAHAGKKLLGTLGGIGCITCHRWDKRPSLGIQALDLSTMRERLQPAWFRKYLLNPAAYRAGTLMPPFWPGGKAMNTAILGGDTEAQIAAIYATTEEPEGYPAHQSSEFELVPQDRPIVQRTFMKGVGSQAILVGFPVGMHIAYDAKLARPALVWKGKFFDAYHTWFSREAPFEEPLGEIIAKWPASKENAGVFKGYRLDASGVPTFLIGAAEDRLEPKDGALHRWVKGELNVQHPEGAQVEEVSPKHFVYTWK